ncbi:phage protein NinX family protein [Morganella morganii]|uniref:phage protein NinX family protein n=1 Tax=Morganella morganii TaxID=582 RepID=UPI0034E43C8E
MNKYRDKSDSEINKAVAEYYLTREYRFNSENETVELIDIDLSCEFGSKINREDTQVVGTFAPCNNPADAMPIVEKYGIGLMRTANRRWFASSDMYKAILHGAQFAV